MSYQAYLQNTEPGHNKHYLIAVVAVVAESGLLELIVRTAWGRIGAIHGEKTYRGGKTSAFTNEAQAEAYARAIVRAKTTSEGYCIIWSNDPGCGPTPPLVTGSWFNLVDPFPPPRKIVVKSRVAELEAKFDKEALEREERVKEEQKKEEEDAKKFKPRPRFSFVRKSE